MAFGVVIVLSAAFAAVMPFATVQAARVDAFLPVGQSIVLFADLLTAVFLFSQFSIQPRRALLALASGYIFSGLFAFLQTLDFPGAYSATGLLSGAPSGAAWLFSSGASRFRLLLLPTFVEGLEKNRRPARNGRAGPGYRYRRRLRPRGDGWADVAPRGGIFAKSMLVQYDSLDSLIGRRDVAA